MTLTHTILDEIEEKARAAAKMVDAVHTSASPWDQSIWVAFQHAAHPQKVLELIGELREAQANEAETLEITTRLQTTIGKQMEQLETVEASTFKWAEKCQVMFAAKEAAEARVGELEANQLPRGCEAICVLCKLPPIADSEPACSARCPVRYPDRGAAVLATLPRAADEVSHSAPNTTATEGGE